MTKSFTSARLKDDVNKPEELNQYLLSLAEMLLMVKGREDLYKVFQEQLTSLFPFSDVKLFLSEPSGQYCFDFFTEVFKANTSFLNQEKYNSQCSLKTLKTALTGSASDYKLSEIISLPVDIQREVLQNNTRSTRILSCSLDWHQVHGGIIIFYEKEGEPLTDFPVEIFNRLLPLIQTVVGNIQDNECLEQKRIEQDIIRAFSKSVLKAKDRLDLVHTIREKLAELIAFTDIAVTTYRPENGTFQVFAHQVNEKMGGHPKFRKVIEPEYPVHDGIHEIALYADGLVLVDIRDALQSPNKHAGTQFIYDSGIRKMLLIKLVVHSQVIGFLNILSANQYAFQHVNRAILQGIADELSLAMSSILAREENLRKNQENEALLSISGAILSNTGIEEITEMIFSRLGAVIYFNDVYISTYNITRGSSKVLSYAGDLLGNDFGLHVGGEISLLDDMHLALNNSPSTICFSFDELRKMKMAYVDYLIHAGVRECACIKLTNDNELIGSITFTSDKQNGFSGQDCMLIERLSYHLSAGLANRISRQKVDKQFDEIQKYKELLQEENEYLLEEANEGYKYEDIIGSGPRMQDVFHLLSQVSFTNSTILLLGETGTGKEMVARAIHNASGRKDKLMVKVNCAALPPNLIESELFGHERGSFTGATERRIGKFELANRGTLFLDEIGELSLDLQTKLLRAIQEREIDRVGGKVPVKVDIRIIAATNRNLLTEVNEGRFRSDLYYRLNVFPITLPPLRERKEDIPSLASHFIGKFSKNTGKKITQISSNALKELNAYTWPGNVRELEHVIERCVLMNRDHIIRHVHLPGVTTAQSKIEAGAAYTKTHEENERDYIIMVLNSCGGKIYGIGGAAQVLDLKVGTLNSKIKKLGIRKEHVLFKKEKHS